MVGSDVATTINVLVALTGCNEDDNKKVTTEPAEDGNLVPRFVYGTNIGDDSVTGGAQAQQRGPPVQLRNGRREPSVDAVSLQQAAESLQAVAHRGDANGAASAAR